MARVTLGPPRPRSVTVELSSDEAQALTMVLGSLNMAAANAVSTAAGENYTTQLYFDLRSALSDAGIPELACSNFGPRRG